MPTIRPIQKQDLPVLGKVYAKVYEVFDVGERWDERSATALMEYWFAKQPDLAYLAESDGQVVAGFITGIKPWWDGNHLFDGEVFVHPDYQGKGVGKELFKKVLQQAVEKYDAKVFDAFTFNGSEFPLNWYKRIGFHEITEWTMFSGNVREVLDNLNRE